MHHKRRVLIVEDHTLLRQGLQSMLSTEPDLLVVGEAADGRQGIQLAASLVPDLILMDLSMPGINGTEAIVEIKRRHPDILILVLTVYKIEEYVRVSLRAGADGYVLKHATREELLQAIRSTLAGKTYLSPEVADQVINRYLGGEKDAGFASALEQLTARERQVLKLIAEGLPNKSIANYLCLSVKTVETHRYNLMKKLDMHNTASLTTFAIAQGMVSGYPGSEPETGAPQSDCEPKSDQTI